MLSRRHLHDPRQVAHGRKVARELARARVVVIVRLDPSVARLQQVVSRVRHA
jgi:hypothetical protein